MNNIGAFVFGVIILTIVIGALVGLPVMWLWNGCLVPAVTGVNEIGFLQAWGLFILCGLLFKTLATTKEK